MKAQASCHVPSFPKDCFQAITILKRLIKKNSRANGFAFEIEKELGKKISSFIHQVLVILTKSKFSCPSISKMFIKDRETCRGSKRTSYKFS